MWQFPMPSPKAQKSKAYRTSLNGVDKLRKLVNSSPTLSLFSQSRKGSPVASSAPRPHLRVAPFRPYRAASAASFEIGPRLGLDAESPETPTTPTLQSTRQKMTPSYSISYNHGPFHRAGEYDYGSARTISSLVDDREGSNMDSSSRSTSFEEASEDEASVIFDTEDYDTHHRRLNRLMRRRRSQYHGDTSGREMPHRKDKVGQSYKTFDFDTNPEDFYRRRSAVQGASSGSDSSYSDSEDDHKTRGDSVGRVLRERGDLTYL